MRYQIYPGIDRERLVSLIPSRLQSRIPEWLPEDEVYTLILVRSSIEVARSAILSRALEELGDAPGRLVAAANEFTKDALEMLNARGALVVAAGDFYWTDDSYEEVRVLIGAKVKKPQHR